MLVLNKSNNKLTKVISKDQQSSNGYKRMRMDNGISGHGASPAPNKISETKNNGNFQYGNQTQFLNSFNNSGGFNQQNIFSPSYATNLVNSLASTSSLSGNNSYDVQRFYHHLKQYFSTSQSLALNQNGFASNLPHQFSNGTFHNNALLDFVKQNCFNKNFEILSRIAMMQAQQFTNYQMRMLTQTRYDQNLFLQNVMNDGFVKQNGSYPLAGFNEKPTTGKNKAIVYPNQSSNQCREIVSGNDLITTSTVVDDELNLTSFRQTVDSDGQTKSVKHEKQTSFFLGKNHDETS